MRILALTGWLPYPPDNGARIRTHYLLQALAERDHRVEVIAFRRRPLPDLPQLPYHVVATVPHREPQTVNRWHWLSPRPRSLRAGYSPAMAHAVTQALTRREYERIISFEIGPGTLTSHYVPVRYRARQIVEDLELWMLFGQLAEASPLFAKLRRRLMWMKAVNYTRTLLRSVRGCTVASEQEAALVRRIATVKQLAIIPNGVDGERCRPLPNEEREVATLIFPGALTYEANFRAMRFFLTEVWPRVQVKRPEAKVLITGSTAGVNLEALPLDARVVLTGYVEDVYALIARSTLCIVPILDGGGTRLKILEALNCGTPVVTTTKGAEGLTLRNGEHLLIADAPAAFAEAVVRLLDDGALRARLGEAGRRCVLTHYEWRAIGALFEAFVRA